jgi:hypothetical protein
MKLLNGSSCSMYSAGAEDQESWTQHCECECESQICAKRAEQYHKSESTHEYGKESYLIL